MILRFLFVAVITLPFACAQDYCSLVVHVASPSGYMVSGVPAEVEEPNGRVVTGVVERGEIRFCDLGISTITIRIGNPYCNQTVVRNVRVTWGSTREVRTMFDPCLVVDEPPPIFPCYILFRFKDEGGRWVSDVKLKPTIRRQPNLKSDSYGRALVAMEIREELRTATDKPGFVREPIVLDCSWNMAERERIVTLRKSP